MRVLVVEDEERLARSIVRLLTDAGMSVDHAADGNDGLWRARECSYDVLVLDRMLPGLDGATLCRTLRDEADPTPILMLTAMASIDDETDGFDAGADDYLRKPFSPKVLLARVHALSRRGAVAPACLVVGDLELDPQQRTCSRAGSAVELTPREFAVLEALARRSPAVVPKGELLDLVWGFDFEGDPSIVEVYVSYLRRKVDRGYEQPLIHTARGVGYRLVA